MIKKLTCEDLNLDEECCPWCHEGYTPFSDKNCIRFLPDIKNPKYATDFCCVINLEFDRLLRKKMLDDAK